MAKSESTARRQPAGGVVREMTWAELEGMVDYFHTADDSFLAGMGVDPTKLPSPADWLKLLRDDLALPPAEKRLFYLTWEVDGAPVGHSNINEIQFGRQAYMHLHLWRPADRRQGLGQFFVERSVQLYFDRFDLERLYCQPFALNPAPNRLLSKLGFQFVKKYETRPGPINVLQQVNLWMIERAFAKAIVDSKAKP